MLRCGGEDAGQQLGEQSQERQIANLNTAVLIALSSLICKQQRAGKRITKMPATCTLCADNHGSLSREKKTDKIPAAQTRHV